MILRKPFVLSAVIVLSASACSSLDLNEEREDNFATQIEDIADAWKDGQRDVERGRRLIERGRTGVEEARSELAQRTSRLAATEQDLRQAREAYDAALLLSDAQSEDRRSLDQLEDRVDDLEDDVQDERRDVAKARENIRESQDRIREGEELVRRGERRMIEAETAYRRDTGREADFDLDD